ncbi:MAG: aminoacyl-tRNA hydrolase [Ruminococcus sp.]|nr:aminoacyl-tRNA hydrolase [Ruminococcus sp.]
MSIWDIFKKVESERGSQKPEYIIAGLGNPGLTYEGTRHNAGFMAIDKLLEDTSSSGFKMKFKSKCTTAVVGGKSCLILKPETFMNNSGEAIEAAMSFYKIPIERVVIAFDDISLDVGKLRIRRKGSHGGHNGIKSIVALTGSEDFPRVKIGVGKKPRPDYDLAKWVLSKFSKSEQEALDSALTAAAESIRLIVSGKIDEAMNKFNS